MSSAIIDTSIQNEVLSNMSQTKKNAFKIQVLFAEYGYEIEQFEAYALWKAYTVFFFKENVIFPDDSDATGRAVLFMQLLLFDRDVLQTKQDQLDIETCAKALLKAYTEEI